MRFVLFVLSVVAATTVLNTPTKAENYPWCAIYGGGNNGGATNCGFVNSEQCMAYVRGIGGYCMMNNTYQSSPGSYPLTKRRHPY